MTSLMLSVDNDIDIKSDKRFKLRPVINRVTTLILGSVNSDKAEHCCEEERFHDAEEITTR
jgi:hypothetical protein